jgi:hypothetical protein
MKKTITLILIILAHATFAQLANKKVETTIKDVTLYKQGAQVTRQTEIKLKKGDNELTLVNLSAELEPGTIQVKDMGSCTILSVSHKLDYSKEESRKTEISKIKTQFDANKEELTKLVSEYEVYSKEEKLLEAYTIPTTNDKQILSLASMKETLDFYRSRLLEIKNKIMEINAAIKELAKAKSLMGTKLDSLLAKEDQPTGTIEMKVNAKRDTALTLQFSYYVNKAGWSAIYDVRVNSVAEPIRLVAKANVHQETGEDWNNVSLTLTSSNPVSINESPILNKWTLSRYASSSPKPIYCTPNNTNTTGICTLKGKITDNDTGEPLPFASVILSSDNKVVGSAITDIDGNYTIRATDAGKYDLKIVYVGYTSKVLNGITLYKNYEVERDAGLNKSTVSLNEVTIQEDKQAFVDGVKIDDMPVQAQLQSVAGVRSNYASNSSQSDYKIEANTTNNASYNKKAYEEKNMVPNKTVYTPTSFQYSIDVPYTIPADGKDYLVQIKEFSVPAMYEYTTTPKADNKAFLMANIIDWDQFNLMPGPTSLYYEGTYIGASYLNVGSVDDTLKVSLGNDQSINIKRERMKDVRSRKFMSSSVKETFGWEISVRNNKKENITIDVIDQYPVSVDNDIVVELLETSNAVNDDKKGELKWKVDMKPGETKKFQIKYSVKYPETYELDLQ